MKKKQEQSKENMFAHAWMQPGTSILTLLYFFQGKMCWVEVDEKQKAQEAFYTGQIVSFKEDYSSVEITYIKGDGPTTLASILLQEKNEEEEDVEDMINLAILNDAELLYHVNKRFSAKLIYTYIGPTLLAMNPYKVYENQIGMEPLVKFQEFIKIGGRIDELRNLPPCIYAISAEIWLQLLQNEMNQALVISGESGAGKTENIKFAMKFLTMLQISSQEHSQDKKGIEERILKCNPILEAFGNAKTVRNDNSSRFGKYVTLYVNRKTWKIQGAETIIYMLEKSRIPSQAEGERCYHIFYHFLRGMSEEQLQKYHLIDKGHKLDFVRLFIFKCSFRINLLFQNNQNAFQQRQQMIKHYMKKQLNLLKICHSVMMK